jgi:hypothetical protein
MATPTLFNNKSSAYTDHSSQLASIFALAAARTEKIANVVRVFENACDPNNQRPGTRLSFFGTPTSAPAKSAAPPAAVINTESPASSSSSSFSPT